MTHWFFATRPWSFTASAIPISLGAALALDQGTGSLWLFCLTLCGGILLHAATNLWNTWGDFISGVDTLESSSSHAFLVRGILQPQAVHRAAWILLMAAGGIGLALMHVRGWEIALFGCVGAFGGYAYTCGRSPYKYCGLGPLMVFILMGPAMAVPAWYIQCGELALTPLVLSLPVGCLVTAIMHANDMRDMDHDRAAGIRTVALRLGYTKALQLYTILCLGAYVLLLTLCAFGLAPRGTLLVMLLLPAHLRLLVRLHKAESCAAILPTLDTMSAKLHAQFGILLIAGVILPFFVQRFFGE